MPTVVPLQAIPNQTLTMQLNGSRVEIEVRAVREFMALTITRDGRALVSGMRAVAGSPVIPFDYLWAGWGNFIFTETREGEAPAWEAFGTTCVLVFSTAAEIAEAVGNG